MDDVVIRPAMPSELDELLAMQARAMRVLSTGWYAPEVVEAMIAALGTLDPELIEDGTYHVAVVGGYIAGSAGWTRRQPNYVRMLADPPPAACATADRCGTVRSVYVAPEYARRGLGTRLLRHVEAEMRRAGLLRAELMGTLSGQPLYCSLGYAALGRHRVLLPHGLAMPVVHMAKKLDNRVPAALAA